MLTLTILDYNSFIPLSATNKSWQKLLSKDCLVKQIILKDQELESFWLSGKKSKLFIIKDRLNQKL